MENNSTDIGCSVVKMLDAIKDDITRRCSTCRFSHNEAYTFVCRRHSPKAEKADGWRRQWPYVFEDDWCGDWE